jgi:hypothetical protein
MPLKLTLKKPSALSIPKIDNKVAAANHGGIHYATNAEWYSINSVKLWKDNPRSNEQAVPRLMELLKSHGQRGCIVAWKDDSVIYKGNTTWKALKRLQKEWLVCKEGQSRELFEKLRKGLIKIEFNSFPSEQAAIAYGLADNKSSEWAEWDDEILTKLMGSEKIELGKTGFSESEKRFLFMESDISRIDKINAAPGKMQDKIVVMICDASSKSEIIELLQTWIDASGLKNLEIKK